MSDIGTFDSLNFVPSKGSTPLGLGLIYDTLMVVLDGRGFHRIRPARRRA